MTIAKIPPNKHAVKAGEIKDKIRMTGSARKASEVQKKKRVAQRQEKLVREQEARERKVVHPMPAELSMKKLHWGQSQLKEKEK
jgi:Flp pilus assembly secretin CpaC